MKILPLIAGTVMLGITSAFAATTCPAPNRPLFYHPQASLTEYLTLRFSDSLFSHLRKPLMSLGHCLVPEDAKIAKDSEVPPLGIWVTAHPSEGGVMVVAAVLPEDKKSSDNLRLAFNHPLAELEIQPTETEAATLFFSQKLLENLRTQFLAQVYIVSHPDSALVKTRRGLEGHTPLEWVLPLGNLQITVSHPGYLTRKYTLELSRPGDHTASLPLVKRHFYHSRLFPVTLTLLASSAISYYLENEYYSQYHQLGLEDQKQRPERFKQLFTNAQNWEKATVACLATAAVTFGLTFRF